MGIETALIIGAVVGAAGTGVSAHQSRVARREGRDAARDQQNAMVAARQEQDSKDKMNAQAAGSVAAAARQRALSASTSTARQDVFTNNLGSVGQANLVQKKLTGE